MTYLNCSALTVIQLKRKYFRTRPSPKIQFLRAEVFFLAVFWMSSLRWWWGLKKKLKGGNSIRVNSPWYVITVPSPSDSILISYSGFSVKDPIFSEIIFSVPFYGAGHQILVRIRDIFKMLRLLRMASPRETKSTPITSTTRTTRPRSDFLPESSRGPNGAN